MNKVQGVSLPRCGHNLLVQHLRRYFTDSIVCPDYRKQLLPFVAKAKMRRVSIANESLAESHHADNPFHYCEYYYSCRSIPCCDATNTFQKSHDFELQLPVEPNHHYIVQTRNQLGLLISWYELRLPRKREVDSPDGFIAFARRMQPYLDGFRKKWTQGDLPNRLVIAYEDYLQEPVKHLAAVIKSFDAGIVIDSTTLKEIVGDVKPAKDNSLFRYYDVAMSSGLFDQARKLAS